MYSTNCNTKVLLPLPTVPLQPPSPDPTVGFSLSRDIFCLLCCYFSHNKWYIQNIGETVYLTPPMGKRMMTAAQDTDVH